MILFKKAGDLTSYVKSRKLQSDTIGFVPTMGALHSGHLSLIEASKSSNDRTIVSIFVNPTQFNDPNDFQQYPVTLEKDILQLEQAGTDVLFLPSVEQIYPQGVNQQEHYDLGYLETILEGKYRPGHFQGVCQVMHRLITLTQPDDLYMGQKDYQQCLVIKELLKIKHLPANLNICATRREPDGLAMSSRNLRLNEHERQRATAIFKTLRFMKEGLQEGRVDGMKMKAVEFLTQQQFKVDYVEIADADTLELVDNWNGKSRLAGLVAAFNNDVRLIDNMIITAN